MKSEKGITLTSLVIYMVIFTIIIGIITTMSSNFLENLEKLKGSPKYVSEFNKFSMFFIKDVKNNQNATVTDTKVEFEDGTKYEYKDNCIYRNEEIIAKSVKQCKFMSSTYELNLLIKNIVSINTTLGNEKEEITRNIDFVLKYW